MNRQALRSIANTENDDDVNGPSNGTAVRNDGDTAHLSASSLAEDGKELAQRSYDYAVRTLRENPTLALAGVVAVGALATLAFMPRRTEPRSVARNMQRDIVRHTRDLRKVVRQELRDSGAANTFNDFSKVLSNVDWKPYIQPLVEQASALAQQANAKLTGKST